MMKPWAEFSLTALVIVFVRTKISRLIVFSFLLSLSSGSVAMTPEEMMGYLPELEKSVRPWSWDTPSRWAEIRKTRGPFTKEEIDIVCQAATICGDSTFAEYYPDILYTAGYMNLEKDTRGAGLQGHYLEAPEHFLYKKDGTVLTGGPDDKESAWFNLAHPGLREWWLSEAARQIEGNENKGCSFFVDALAKVGNVAGGDFYDHRGKPVGGDDYWDAAETLMAELRARYGDKVFITGNFARPGTGSKRTGFSMDYTHISYIESFEHFGRYVETAHEAIALMQELSAAGKWIQITVNAYSKPIPMADITLDEKRAKAKAAMPEIWAEYTEQERDELAEIYAYFPFKLAMFLMGAGERSYLKYTASKVVRTSGRDLFKNIMPFPEWDMPLGPPLEPAQRDGNVYTRKFKYVEVVLNLDDGTCQFIKGESPAPKPKKVKAFKVTYSPAKGLGKRKNIQIRDNSDVIKVGNLYYVWYQKQDAQGTSIWFATSPDGREWTEKELCVGVGQEGQWDGAAVLSPGILVVDNRYYLTYTGIRNAAGDLDWEHSKARIGMAVADSPDGPWKKLPTNPVLEPSHDESKFDGYRVDDSCLIVRDRKYWLYYKGAPSGHNSGGSKIGLAVARTPEGPYSKYPKNPVIYGGHEVLVWPQGEGVAAMIGKAGGSGVPQLLVYAQDGLHFKKTQTLKQKDLPWAPGAYRPEAYTDSGRGEMIEWGLHIGGTGPELFLERFDFVDEN